MVLQRGSPGAQSRVIEMSLAWASAREDLASDLAEAVTIGASALDALYADAAAELGRPLTPEEEVAGILACVSGNGRRLPVALAASELDTITRPNLTTVRASVLVAAGLLPQASPATSGGRPLRTAKAVLEGALRLVVVRTTPDAVSPDVLRRHWLRPRPITCRPWHGNRLGRLPCDLTAGPVGDGRDWLLRFGALWLARLGGDASDAVVALVRRSFPQPPAPGLDDPFAVAAVTFGRPLTSAEAALLAERLLGWAPEPPGELVDRLAAVLDILPTPLMSPLHAAIALGPHDLEGAGRLSATGVLLKLLATSVSALNGRAKAKGMAASGRLFGTSVDRVAEKGRQIVVDETCRCGHHSRRLYGCKDRGDGVGRVCGSRCCRHSLRPFLEPVRNPQNLEPLGIAAVRILSGRADGRLYAEDLDRGLYPRLLVECAQDLEWRTPRGLATFDVQTGSVLFTVCACGHHHEESSCPRCSRGVGGTLAVEDHWIFAHRIDGWFEYDEEDVFACPNPLCDFYFRSDRESSKCPCGWLREITGPGRTAWTKLVIREGFLGDTDVGEESWDDDL